MSRIYFFILLLLILTPTVAKSDVVYLKNGESVECQSFWRDKEGVHVKIEEGAIIEFQTNEVDMKKTLKNKQKQAQKVIKQNNNLSAQEDRQLTLRVAAETFVKEKHKCINASNPKKCEEFAFTTMLRYAHGYGITSDEFIDEVMNITKNGSAQMASGSTSPIRDSKDEVWQYCKRGYLNKLENPSSAIFEDDPMRMETIKPNGNFNVTSTIYARSGGVLKKHLGSCEGNTSDFSSVQIRVWLSD